MQISEIGFALLWESQYMRGLQTRALLSQIHFLGAVWPYSDQFAASIVLLLAIAGDPSYFSTIDQAGILAFFGQPFDV